MDSVRMRFLIVGQSSADILQRLEQAREASARLDATQEDLALWLARLEKELLPEGGWPEGGLGPVTAADVEKLEQALRSEMDQTSRFSSRLDQLGPLCLDAQALPLQLADQKRLSAEILHHHSIAERLVPVTDRLLSLCPSDLQKQLQPLAQRLREEMEQLVHRSSARGAQVERAQLLLAQYAEAQEALQPWLEETPSAVALLLFSSEDVSCETFREHQERLQLLREAAAERKPLLAKLQRVSAQLGELSPQEAAPFQQGWRLAEERFRGIRERIQQAAAVMEEAIPRYSQLSERMELMEECLERLRGRMERPLAVRGDAAWLREQVRENSLRLGELERLGTALETLRGQGAELLAALQTGTHQGIQNRVAQLLGQWEALWREGETRETWLHGLLTLADRFWQGLSDLAATLGDTQELVLDLEEGPSEPEAIRARLAVMQALRGEIDSLQSDLDSLGSLGVELMSSCGHPDKPDVTKSLDELYSCWHRLSKVWTERQAHLEQHLQASQAYQEAMEGHLGWLEKAELRMAEEFLVRGDVESVKQQLLELKEFKRELYQRKVDVESLRHQVAPKGGSQKDPPATLGNFRLRWNCLEDEIVSRQHQLEAALLGLGQFQNQLEELLQWLLHTRAQLQGPPTFSLDLQTCEIELAKHKVLRNDVLSHAHTVRSVEEAGRGLLLSSGRDSVAGLQGRLQQLSQHWDFVLGETERRQLELENSLCQVQDLTLEVTELLQWLEHVELQLFFSKPLGGPPETTKDKLAAHGELCKEMDSRQQAFHTLREQVRHLLATRHLPRGASSTEHSLSLLEQKWASVSSQVQERKEQLSESLTVTTEFHSTVQELLKWVEKMEERLGTLPPPSYILDTVTHQIQEQKALMKEAQKQRERVEGLEEAAARVKDLSRPQEGTVAHSLALSAKERLAKVLQELSDQGGALDEARKGAKQFHESWQLLMDWLEQVELPGDPGATAAVAATTALSQEGIRALLAEHKEFQKVLCAKRPVYEATLRSGRLIREKARRPEDTQRLEEMLQELKARWDRVCGWAAERQCKLEEDLLFSGRFTDALQTLMDWLYQAEPQLAEETPVAGDRDVVGTLMDKHKVFQKELGQRASCIKTLRRSVRDLMRGGGWDSQWLQRQVEELGHRWELVCQLSLSKQDRLEAALRQAEEFHRLLHSFLGRLAELERSVKRTALPTEEAALREGQQQLTELRQGLQCQQLELECLVSLGEEILSACHLDAVIPLRSWVAVAKSRFQEVLSWAEQQEEQLQARLASVVAEQEEVAQLLDWIGAAEEALSLREQEPLPEDAQQLEELSAQHAVFMEELNRKQPEVEKVTQSGRHKVPKELGLATAPRKLSSRRRGTHRPSLRAPAVPLEEREPRNSHLAQVGHRWQQLWLLALDRQYHLQTSQQRLRELEEFAHFDFAVWRKRYMHWISQMKSRVLDVFRGIDRDQDGRITEQEFIESVLASKFPTNTLEMNAVAKIFDLNGDGFIDYYEFVSALHPSRDVLRRAADADKIQDEVNRQVAQCSCAKRFQVEQISANRYRFGESQQLRMVRILRSTLMVRVGGGWIALDEFLVKNDPCRVKGRTNVKINEKYLSPDPQAGGRGPTGQSTPASKVLSPSGSSLSLYSSASAPSSPLPRKSVLRRTRSGDRSLHSCSSLLPDGAELTFVGTAQEGSDPDGAPTEAEPPPDPPGGPPP
uniref:Microtubule-actin cross-linking factor 1, isoforms 6/7-like n=1 Tax=Pogona vitticeps TaxID=103695 RepID=A0ABM5GD79_9SAUR